MCGGVEAVAASMLSGARCLTLPTVPGCGLPSALGARLLLRQHCRHICNLYTAPAVVDSASISLWLPALPPVAALRRCGRLMTLRLARCSSGAPPSRRCSFVGSPARAPAEQRCRNLPTHVLPMHRRTVVTNFDAMSAHLNAECCRRSRVDQQMAANGTQSLGRRRASSNVAARAVQPPRPHKCQAFSTSRLGARGAALRPFIDATSGNMQCASTF